MVLVWLIKEEGWLEKVSSFSFQNPLSVDSIFIGTLEKMGILIIAKSWHSVQRTQDNKTDCENSLLLEYLFTNNVFLFLDWLRDWTSVWLTLLLRVAGLSALRGEEADEQREQGAGDRLQRQQAHQLWLHLPGRVHRQESEEHLPRGAAHQGAGGGQQCHGLNHRLHCSGASQPSHHPGNISWCYPIVHWSNDLTRLMVTTLVLKLISLDWAVIDSGYKLNIYFAPNSSICDFYMSSSEGGLCRWMIIDCVECFYQSDRVWRHFIFATGCVQMLFADHSQKLSSIDGSHLERI